MKIIPTEIDGVLILEPRLFQDSRGYFFESFNQKEFAEKSVTALVGISDRPEEHCGQKCLRCQKQDCPYRMV